MEQQRTVPKRFIAGAVCPRCGMMDRVLAWQEDDKECRECVSCGFYDVLEVQPKPIKELETRVTPDKTQADPIKIIGPDEA